MFIATIYFLFTSTKTVWDLLHNLVSMIETRQRMKIILTKSTDNNSLWYICFKFIFRLPHQKGGNSQDYVCLFCDGIKNEQKVPCWPLLKWWHIIKCTKHFAELIQWYWRSVTSHLCWHTDCWCKERLTWQLSRFIVWGVSPSFHFSCGNFSSLTLFWALRGCCGEMTCGKPLNHVLANYFPVFSPDN